MQRFIGSICIVTATTLMGIQYGKSIQNYIDKMLYIRHLMYMIKSEIEYTNATLGDIYERIAVRVKEPYRSWFHVMKKQIDRREKREFFKIWCYGIDRYLSELHLRQKHIHQLKQMGMCIGSLDREAEVKNIQLQIEGWESEIERLKEGVPAKQRIGRCIGVMSGAFLVVLLF